MLSETILIKATLGMHGWIWYLTRNPGNGFSFLGAILCCQIG